jgi:integrase
VVAGSITLKIKKESHIGTLHLVRNAPGHLPPESPLAPASHYLYHLAESGRRSQKARLVRAGTILGGAGLDFDWYSLRAHLVELVCDVLQREGLSASSINATLSALKEVAAVAARLKPEWLTPADLAAIRAVKRARMGRRVRRVRALSELEVGRLLDICDRRGGAGGARDAALIALLFGAGLRRDEASKLKLSDYNARRHTLFIQGKGGRNRTAYFEDGGALRALNWYLRERGKEPGPLLCPVTRWGEVQVEDEHYLSGVAIYRALQRRARDAGIERFGPHDLRRSFGTELLNEGCDLSLVSKLMGHASITSTVIYDQRGEKEKRAASLKISVPFRTRGGRGKRKKRRRRRK